MINCCWIAPEGKIHPVDFHKHGNFARRVLGDDSLHPEQAIVQLAKQGWLHVGLSPFVSFRPYHDLRDAQIKALFIVLDECTSGLVEQNITAYIHA